MEFTFATTGIGVRPGEALTICTLDLGSIDLITGLETEHREWVVWVSMRHHTIVVVQNRCTRRVCAPR